MSARKPESEMMHYGFNPMDAHGAVKPPIYQTSTFVFNSAEEGKHFFEGAYGLREMEEGEELGYIYSRIDNPNLKVLEQRLALLEGADDSAVFQSGMAAISTALMEFLPQGSVLIASSTLYGGTDHFMRHVLAQYGIDVHFYQANDSAVDVITAVNAKGWAGRVSAVYVETPANPTLDIFCLKDAKKIAEHFATEENAVPLIVDNTYMGPVFCKPMEFGADLVLYSATKYLGGHSDIVAGVVSGKADLMQRIRVRRTFYGNMMAPFNSWLLTRSLETLHIRVRHQAATAESLADWIKEQPQVQDVLYLKYAGEKNKQYTGYGAMIGIKLHGGEAESFRFLNALKLIKLAVSLGGTESLAEHPFFMTHIDVPAEEKAKIGITENLVRISVGLEDLEDLKTDIQAALSAI